MRYSEIQLLNKDDEDLYIHVELSTKINQKNHQQVKAE